MESLIRLLVVVASLTAASAAPLFYRSFSLEKRYFELKGFNNAADILVMVPDPADALRSVPALLRGDSFIDLYPTGEGPFTSVFVDGISERRENGGVFVAGTTSTADGFFRAAIWDVAADRSFTFKVAPNIILPEDSSAPGEQLYGYGLAVNTSGVLVGSGSSYLASLATIWAPPYNTAVRYLLSTGSSFIEINESGLLLANGVEFDHGGAFNRLAPAVLVAGGVPMEVPALELTPGWLYPNRAVDMAGEWVTGVSQYSNRSRAFVWKRGAGASVHLPNIAEYPDAEDTIPWGVNSSGNVVGMINGGASGGNIIYWENQNGTPAAHRFSALVPEEPYVSHVAEDARINDNNQMVFVIRSWGGSSIVRYDPLTDGLVQIVEEASYATESEGRVNFRLNLFRAPGHSGPVAARVRTLDGAAVAPTDYTALDTTVTWAANEAGEKTVTIAIPDNNTYEEDRDFTLQLVSATGAQLGSRRESTGHIMDDSGAIYVRNSMFGEGYSGVAVLRGQSSVAIELERVGGSDGAMTVSGYEFMDLTAFAGRDFAIPTLPTLTWARGELGVKTITIPLLEAETFETGPILFNLSAKVIQEGSEFEDSVYATVTILPADDRSSPTVREWSLNASKTTLTLDVMAPQGSVVQLRRSTALDGGWTTADEQTSTEGTVRFSVPVSTAQARGFYNVRIKP